MKCMAISQSHGRVLRALTVKEELRSLATWFIILFILIYVCLCVQWEYRLFASNSTILLAHTLTSPAIQQTRNFNAVIGHMRFPVDYLTTPLTDFNRKCNIVEMSVTPEGNFTTVPLNVIENLQICVHPNATEDKVISAAIKRGFVWESGSLNFMMKYLEENGNMGVFDIGANIGEYSLVAAMLGHKVVAVEALKQHVDMLHMSAILNNVTDRVTLLHNAISNDYRMVQMETIKGNMGSTHVQSMPDSGVAQQKAKQVRTILMDDLVEVTTFDQAVMKIDIETHEPYAFANASRLFAKVQIQFVQMEWGLMIRRMRKKTPAYLELMDNMIQFFTDRHYKPVVGQNVLDINNWRKWPWDIIWKHKDTKF